MPERQPMPTTSKQKPSVAKTIIDTHDAAVKSARTSVNSLEEQDKQKANRQKAQPPAQPNPVRDLSFMRNRKAGSNEPVYWNVDISGDYGADCEKGAALAAEYLNYLGEHPTYGNSTLLGQIVGDLLKRHGARLSGLEVGFFTEVNRKAMGAAALLHGYASDPETAPSSFTTASDETSDVNLEGMIARFESAAAAAAGEDEHTAPEKLYAQDQTFDQLVDYRPVTLDEVYRKVRYLIDYDTGGDFFGYRDDNTYRSSLLRSLAAIETINHDDIGTSLRQTEAGRMRQDTAPSNVDDLITNHRRALARLTAAADRDTGVGATDPALQSEIRESMRAEFIAAVEVAAATHDRLSEEDREKLRLYEQEVSPNRYSDSLSTTWGLPLEAAPVLAKWFRGDLIDRVAQPASNTAVTNDANTAMSELIAAHASARKAFETRDDDASEAEGDHLYDLEVAAFDAILLHHCTSIAEIEQRAVYLASRHDFEERVFTGTFGHELLHSMLPAQAPENGLAAQTNNDVQT